MKYIDDIILVVGTERKLQERKWLTIKYEKTPFTVVSKGSTWDANYELDTSESKKSTEN